MSSENGETTEKKSITEVSTLERRIIRQVEYYFGDVNLARDRFLQAQIKEDDGWVTMETMLKFNRLATLSDDPKVIVEALKKSTSGLMEINEDGTKIRRCPDKPLPLNTMERRDDIKHRSLYVKGFPTTFTMNDLLDWFEAHGPPENIQMRRTTGRDFKGSVFVLFKTKTDCETFLAKDIKHEDTDLIKMLKEDYFKMKAEEKKSRNKESAKKQEEEKEKKTEEERQSVLDRMTKGAILRVKGLKDNISPVEIREFFTVPVAWVEYEKGNEEAWVRFSEEGGAQKGWDAAKNEEGKVIFKECELTEEILEGEAEYTYWKNRFKGQADQKKFRRGRGSGRGRGRGRGRGGRFGSRGKRSQDSDEEGSDDDEPSTKKIKTDDGAVKRETDTSAKPEADTSVKLEADTDVKVKMS